MKRKKPSTGFTRPPFRVIENASSVLGPLAITGGSGPAGIMTSRSSTRGAEGGDFQAGGGGGGLTWKSSPLTMTTSPTVASPRATPCRGKGAKQSGGGGGNERR